MLLDQNLSARLGRLLIGHDVIRASSVGWAELSNGVLLKAAEQAGFEIFLTGDRNIQHQTNMAGRKIAVIVLGTNRLSILLANVERIAKGLAGARAGNCTTVTSTARRCGDGRRPLDLNRDSGGMPPAGVIARLRGCYRGRPVGSDAVRSATACARP